MFVHTICAGMCLGSRIERVGERGPVPVCASEQSGRGSQRPHVLDFLDPCSRTGAPDGAPVELRGSTGARVEWSSFVGISCA